MGSFMVGVLVTIVFIVIVSYVGIPSLSRSDISFPGTPPAVLAIPNTGNPY